MQIGHLNHLNFPKGVPQALVGGAADDGESPAALAPGAAKPGLGATVRTLTPAQDAPGVILKLQKDSMATPGPGLANGLVYSNARKSAAAEADSDTERMAEQHRLALERSNGNTTRLSLGKDGVLVAQAAAALDGSADTTNPATPAPDFVTFAVGAMRDYANEQERLKNSGAQDGQGSAQSLIARGLGDVQKLAARFKLFG